MSPLNTDAPPVYDVEEKPLEQQQHKISQADCQPQETSDSQEMLPSIASKGVPSVDTGMVNQMAPGDATLSVIAVLNLRKPGIMYEGGATMSINLAPSYLIKKTKVPIAIHYNMTYLALKDALNSRVERHFGVALRSGVNGNYTLLSIRYKDQRMDIVDDTDWQASKGWLIEGATLQYDFVPRERASFQTAWEEEADKKEKQRKGHRCVVQ
jgi:hypothetical protein